MKVQDGDVIYHAKRNRQTGTEVYAQYSPSADEGMPWETVCATHGGVCCHESRKVAMSFAAVPAEWCEDCMALLERKKIADIMHSTYGKGDFVQAAADDVCDLIERLRTEPTVDREREVMLKCWNWFSGGTTADSVAKRIEAVLEGES